MMNNLMIFDDNNLGGSDSHRRRQIMMLSSFSFDSNPMMINWALGVTVFREVSLLKRVFPITIPGFDATCSLYNLKRVDLT